MGTKTSCPRYKAAAPAIAARMLRLVEREVTGSAPVVSNDGVDYHVFVRSPLSHPLAQEPFAQHSRGLQHLPRRWVADHMMGTDSIQTDRVEAEVDHGDRRFPGVAVTPPLPPDPESEFGLEMLRIDVSQSDRTDQGTAGTQSNGKVDGPSAGSFPSLLSDPRQGAIQLVGMRNGKRGVGDLPHAGQALQLRSVLLRERPERQTRRPQDWGWAHTGARRRVAVPARCSALTPLQLRVNC